MQLPTLVILFCSISLVSSQCDGSTCSTCSAQANCGWCAATDQCLAGSTTGPDTGVCHQTSWFFAGTNPCPDCSTLIGCTACTDNAACGWIAEFQTCGDVTAVGASGYCPCDEYDQCTDCVRAGCTFCSNTGLCQDDSSSNCTVMSPCNCGGFTDCVICSEQDDICQWCENVGCQTQHEECAGGSNDINICLVPVPEPSPCNGTTCSACSAQENCGWCAATDQCLVGTTTGPDDGVCHQTSWFFGDFNPCPDCSSLIGCTACTDNAACGWIAGSESCGDVTAAGASGYCPCDEYDQCTDCVRAGCTFCSNTGVCQDDSSGNCTVMSPCNCDGFSECVLCSEQDDICQWCEGVGCQTQQEECAGGSNEINVCLQTPTPETFTDRNALIVGLSVGWFMFVVAVLVIIILLIVKPGFSQA